MPSLSVPTTAALPPTQRISSTNPLVFRILYKLSRASLLSLVLDWLDDANQSLCAPHLVEDVEAEDAAGLMYPGVQTLEELREIYEGLQKRRGSKREVVDRIIEGDWRDGVSLFQLAMADIQYLYDHPTSQKWTALKVVRLDNESDTESPKLSKIPRFHPATFLQNLQREVLPDVKAHYNLDRPANLPLLLLRIYVLESPYNTSLAFETPSTNSTNHNALDTSKTIYVAFPDGSPHVYVSLATTTGIASISENRSLRKYLLDGIPKAFSRPYERYALQSTGLSARNLEALLVRRGAGRTNAAGGGWGIYAKEKGNTPLDLMQFSSLPASTDEVGDQDKAEPKTKLGMKRKTAEHSSLLNYRKKVAVGRFGESARADDGLGIERLDIRIEDPFPSIPSSTDADFSDDEAPIAADRAAQVALTAKKGRRSTLLLELERDDVVEGGEWRPDVRITLHGTHIFAGVKELVEAGVVDGVKMPGWMTGEEGVSVGVVRDGRIRGFKGSGI